MNIMNFVNFLIVLLLVIFGSQAFAGNKTAQHNPHYNHSGRHLQKLSVNCPTLRSGLTLHNNVDDIICHKNNIDQSASIASKNHAQAQEEALNKIPTYRHYQQMLEYYNQKHRTIERVNLLNHQYSGIFYNHENNNKNTASFTAIKKYILLKEDLGKISPPAALTTDSSSQSHHPLRTKTLKMVANARDFSMEHPYIAIPASFLATTTIWSLILMGLGVGVSLFWYIVPIFSSLAGILLLY